LGRQKMMKQIDKVAGLIEDAQGAALADDAAKRRASCQVNLYDKAAHDAKENLTKEESWNGTEQNGRVSAIPAPYHFYHGNDLFRLKRLPEAEAEYRLAVKTDPAYGEAYNNLINLLFAQKRLDEARTCLSQAETHKAAINPGLKKAVLDSAAK